MAANLLTDTAPSLERLREYPFLASLSDTVLRKLQPHVAEQRLAARELILRLGDYSDAAYYLAEGQVEVRVPDAETVQRRDREGHGRPATAGARPTGVAGAIARLRRSAGGGQAAAGRLPAGAATTAAFERVELTAGDIFGEMGALSRYPVTADVVAISDVRLLKLTTPGLRLMLKQRELAAFRQSIEDRYRARTLASHLRAIELFAGVDEATIDRLRERAELLAFEPGAAIVVQGAAPDGLYLVRGGHVKVSIATAGTPDGGAVTYLRRGEVIGETGLLTGLPWTCSLTAIEHVEMVRLPVAEFAALVDASPTVAARLRELSQGRSAQLDALAASPEATAHLEMAIGTGLINGQSVLLIDLTKCTGCDDCVTACADTHGGTPRLLRQGPVYEGWNIPVACYQCSDPVCMIGCPTGAITRPLGGIEVTIDEATCIGCGNCARRCPWGNIINVPRAGVAAGPLAQVATKCDLCIGRDAGPACVQMCPHGAATRISFQDSAEVARLFTRPRQPLA
ncbi:MAG: cyclic nucleotide-binding domain-containing protein [Acidobacteriota bacterium]